MLVEPRTCGSQRSTLRFYQTETEKSSEELSSHALRTHFPEFAREVGSAKGAPDSRSIGICAARSCCGIHGQGGGPTGKVETHDCMLLRAPIAPSPLTRFFCFSAAGPATDCLLSSELRPSCLLLTAALETTAHHSTTPSGFLGHTSTVVSHVPAEGKPGQSLLWCLPGPAVVTLESAKCCSSLPQLRPGYVL